MFVAGYPITGCTGARRFPGLINCTSVDFFHPWPRQALISVAARFLEDVELGDLSVKDSLAVHMAEEHLSVTKVGGWVGCGLGLCWLRHYWLFDGRCCTDLSVRLAGAT